MATPLAAHGRMMIDNTIIIGRDLTFGTGGDTYSVYPMKDFNPLPPIQISSNDAMNVSAGFGSVLGIDYPGMRRYEFSLMVRAKTATAMAAALEFLNRTMKPRRDATFGELCWRIGAKTMFVLGRYRSVEMTGEFRSSGAAQWCTVKVRFETATPFLYDAQSVSLATSAFSSVLTGYANTRPLNLPLASGAYPSALTQSFTGSGEPYWIATITGPSTNPVIVEDLSGQALAFGHATSQVVLAGGQSLTVNSLDSSVSRNFPTQDNYYIRYAAGGSTVMPKLNPVWGGNSSGTKLLLVGQSGGSTGTLSINYFPAYLGIPT